MKTLIILALFLTLNSCFGDPAEAQSVFAAPAGIGLATNGGPTYSATGTPNWRVSTWSSFDALPPFIDNLSQNKAGWVVFRANGRIAMQVNGRLQPCTRANGSPNEYDIIASPAPAASEPPLSVLHHVVVSGNVYFNPSGPFDEVCPDTFAAVSHALILKNTANGQVLFYQLKLAGAGDHSGALVPAVSATPAWFEYGPVKFGFDDGITTYGGKMVPFGAQQDYSADVLPGLEKAIASAPAGMDRNLADWVINEEYLYDGVWGHMACWAGWGNTAVVEQ